MKMVSRRFTERASRQFQELPPDRPTHTPTQDIPLKPSQGNSPSDQRNHRHHHRHHLHHHGHYDTVVMMIAKTNTGYLSAHKTGSLLRRSAPLLRDVRQRGVQALNSASASSVLVCTGQYSASSQLCKQCTRVEESASSVLVYVLDTIVQSRQSTV